MGKAMDFSPLQHEALLMATLTMLKDDKQPSLSKIQRDDLEKVGFITPSCLALLFKNVKIEDPNFCPILKVLAKGCTLMHQNSPLLIGQFFQSVEFSQLFVKTNQIVDDIWFQRRIHPDKKKELKLKHRHIYNFRTNLLKFLEKQFGQDWVQDFTQTAERFRIRVWPFDEY